MSQQIARSYDTTAETVTTTVLGETPVVEPIDPDVLADLRAAEREERQLTRLDEKLEALKIAERLVVSTYRQDTGPADLREMARQVNDLRTVCKDLIRLVRGLAAEDEV